jgi:hypothetical protein
LNWRHGLFWSGLRGAVSIVLVQGLSKIVLPHSSTMLALTFGIVLFSNLLHGPTIPFVVKRLDIFSSFETAVDLDEEAIVKTFYSDDYKQEGYDFSRSKFEKIFFSAPEFLVKDTRFGTELEIKLRSWWGILKQRINNLQNRFNEMKGY